jgi:hypothetical protein
MKSTAGSALAAAMTIAWDVGAQPSYAIDRRPEKPKAADPKKKAKRKAQRRARRINRNR